MKMSDLPLEDLVLVHYFAPAVRHGACMEAVPVHLREHVDAVARAWEQAVEAIRAAFGEGEAGMPFGLSVRRLESNIFCARCMHTTAGDRCATVLQEIVDAGLGEPKSPLRAGAPA